MAVDARARVTAILGDDAALASWVVEVARATPDVYVRAIDGTPRAESRLRDDLGIDSIGRVCVFYEIVDSLGLTLADEAAAAPWQTLADVVTFVRAALA